MPEAQLPEVFPGYRVEKLEEKEGQIGFAYKIHGPKKTFMLMRNRVHRHMLFVCPEGRSPRNPNIRGISWFSDRDGTLKPAH